MMKNRIPARALLLVLLLPLAFSCEQRPVVEEEPQSSWQRTRNGVNYFAANCMSLYYLWADEVDGALQRWLSQELDTDPIAKVKAIRYKKNGKEIDRWTEMTDDYGAMEASVGGVSTTYGCDIVLMKLDATAVCAVVTVVYKDSPAARAGLQRGDVIVRINGQQILQNNYRILVTEGFLYSKECTLALLDRSTGEPGRSVTMTSVEMYEDPVVYHSIFDVGGKKVGYLVFTSFTLKAIDTLLGVFEQFRMEHVTELILDLRYNGGGYVTTEEVLASMIAPLANVQAGDLFEQQVYNDAMRDFYIKEYGADALKSFFKTSFSWKEDLFTSTCDTRSGHLELDRLYAIIDSGSASASESLLVGLMPYMDVTLIGGQTHGKFCTGIMYGAQEWYDDYKKGMPAKFYAWKEDVKDWGLYVMIGRYADKNGNCPAMPDGLIPDIEAEDRPDLGYGFGDERDPMLREALILAGRTDLKTASTRAAQSTAPDKTPFQVVKPVFGKRILSR